MSSFRTSIRLEVLCVLALCGNALAQQLPTLIGGEPVPQGQWQEVIQISSPINATESAKCTATIVGPRAVITAAHCVKNNAKITFTVAGKNYTGTAFRSTIFPSKDHDVAIAFTDTDIVGITPAKIGGKAEIGTALKLLGYGCTQAQGGGGNDGVLRIGESVIVGFSNFDMVSKKANGAALCYGDSGGPAYVMKDGKALLLGINSKANIQDSNWNTRLDIQQSTDFLKQMAQTNNAVICGINSECGNVQPPPPGDDRPSCTLTASPGTVKVGEMLTLSLIANKATSAKIEGQNATVPTGQINMKATDEGTFTARAEVLGANNTSATCEATFKVEKNTAPPPPQDRPTCTLTANPREVKLKESVTLELVAQGDVNHASIDSTAVTFPVGRLIVTPRSKGEFSATGFVRGPNGSSNCYADYKVSDEGGTTPNIPPYAVIPAYCGENELLESKVYKVCIGVVRKDEAMPDLRVGQVLLITYSDSTKEVMPILSRKTRTRAEGETYVKEDLVLYANGHVNGPDFAVLDTRTATLSKIPPASANTGEVPVSIEGRTGKGKYFLVNQLSAFATSGAR